MWHRGLRLWGNRRRATRYYTCQPSRQRGRGIPDGHPESVYIGERPLLDAITSFLATAVYGPDRLAYWQAVLADVQPDPAAPANARAAELEQEIAELDTRLRRQLLSLEDDDVSPTFRRRVAARIDELEQQLTDRREALDRVRATAPPPPPDLATTTAMLGKLPILGDRLADLPHDTLRELFDSLHLRCTYHHTTREVAVDITLADRPDHSQVWSVHPTLPGSNTTPLIVGPALTIPARHAKIRRDGYYRT